MITGVLEIDPYIQHERITDVKTEATRQMEKREKAKKRKGKGKSTTNIIYLRNAHQQINSKGR